ncbi:MAG: phosphoribosylformylglycinamidine synthase subunit PurQ [Actinomycetota bacterium]|nr:MAG: phosphoribosylformylglycinamidine synthase subunit PurQ [Actinomycetota bacterium]
MTTKSIGIIVFPGSNCEYDVASVLEAMGTKTRFIWHGQGDLGDVSGLILPGGFAHGDYLRPGAIARFSPVMSSVREFAKSGRSVLGICNGFQVLTEAGLLPGALQKNAHLKFLCKEVELEVASAKSSATSLTEIGQRLRLPINHFEGNYTCDPGTLGELESNNQVVLRYVDNPNGSMNSIAGVCSIERNVVGMMPHPERACDDLLGSVDGLQIFKSFISNL